MNGAERGRGVVLRDLLIFQVKLAVDGMKDLVLTPASLGAAALDLLLPGDRPGRRFYAVMRIGERFDRWLSLFAAVEQAEATRDGLFGASPAGAPTLLGALEEIVTGRREVPADAASGGPDGAGG